MSESKSALLIVDDDPEVREILVEILSSVSSKVETAKNGKEALDLILQDNFHCVVSDINMPVMTGLELLKAVRKLSVQIPFVMVSAFGHQDNIREALKLGAADFVDKPFDSSHLKQTVSLAIQYGQLLYDLDAKLEELFHQSKLPPEELQKFKEMQKELWKIKAENQVYLKAS